MRWASVLTDAPGASAWVGGAVVAYANGVKRAVLGVPDRFQVVALIPIGHPVGSFGRARRRPVEKVTHWNTWGERRDPPTP